MVWCLRSFLLLMLPLMSFFVCLLVCFANRVVSYTSTLCYSSTFSPFLDLYGGIAFWTREQHTAKTTSKRRSGLILNRINSACTQGKGPGIRNPQLTPFFQS